MKASEFCYWLQGFFELSEGEGDLSPRQQSLIKQHLDMVFIHDLDPKQLEEKLQAAHDGNKPKPTFGGTGPNGELYRC